VDGNKADSSAEDRSLEHRHAGREGREMGQRGPVAGFSV